MFPSVRFFVFVWGQVQGHLLARHITVEIPLMMLLRLAPVSTVGLSWVWKELLASASVPLSPPMPADRLGVRHAYLLHPAISLPCPQSYP